MSLDLAGALLIGAASVVAGMERSRKEIKKLAILEGLIALVRYIGEEIKNFKTPLMRIFEEFSNDELERCGFLCNIRKGGAVFAVEKLDAGVGEDVKRELLSFAKELGGGYSEGQSALCEVTLARLEKAAEGIRASLPERVRMYRLIPVLVGASVIILLM